MASGTLRQAYHILWDQRLALVPKDFVPEEVVANLPLNPPGF